MKWGSHVACMEKMRIVYKVFVGTPGEMGLLWRFGCRRNGCEVVKKLMVGSRVGLL
jgi:hypothetical protein